MMGNIRREKNVYRLLNYRSRRPNLILKTFKHMFSSSYYFYIDIISKLAKFNWIE